MLEDLGKLREKSSGTEKLSLEDAGELRLTGESALASTILLHRPFLKKHMSACVPSEDEFLGDTVKVEVT